MISLVLIKIITFLSQILHEFGKDNKLWNYLKPPDTHDRHKKWGIYLKPLDTHGHVQSQLGFHRDHVLEDQPGGRRRNPQC